MSKSVAKEEEEEEEEEGVIDKEEVKKETASKKRGLYTWTEAKGDTKCCWESNKYMEETERSGWIKKERNRGE